MALRAISGPSLAGVGAQSRLHAPLPPPRSTAPGLMGRGPCTGPAVALLNGQGSSQAAARRSAWPAMIPGHRMPRNRAPAPAAVASEANAPPSGEEEAKWNAMVKWLTEGGGQVRAELEVAMCPMGEDGAVMVRGLAPGEDAPANQPVLSVPLSKCLCESRIPAPFAGAGWGVAFAAHICQEVGKGDESDHKPYLDTLPLEAVGGLAYVGEMANEIQYEPAAQALDDFRQLSDEGYRACLEAGSLPPGCTQAQFDWAMSAVHSRTMRIKRLGRTMLPALDMINHGGEEHKNGTMAMGRQMWEKEDSLGSIFFVLERKVRAGEQVLWTYGDDRSQDDFFLYYGFVEGDSPHDDVVLFPTLKESVAWYADKYLGGEVTDEAMEAARGATVKAWREGSKAAGVDDQQDEPYHVLRPLEDSGDREPVKHLATLRLHRPDWKGGAPGTAAAGKGGPSNGAVPEVVARRDLRADARVMAVFDSLAAGGGAGQGGGATAAEAVRARCRELLDGFPTTAEEDEALLAGGGVPDGVELAVAYRLGKKRVLRALADSPASA